MADPRFFIATGPFTLDTLAEISGAEIGGGDPQATFADVAPLDEAGAGDVGFLDNRRYADAFAASGAGACVVHPDMAPRAPRGMALLLTDEPYHAYARIARAFYPPQPVEPGVAPTAAIDPTAAIGDGCRVEAGAVVGPGAQVGARCHLGANTMIGPGVVLGDDCVVGPSATIVNSIVGARTVVHMECRRGR